MRALLDQWGGLLTYFEQGERPDDIRVRTWQANDPFLEQNRRERNAGHNPKSDFRKVASIPAGLQLELIRQHGMRPGEFYRRPVKEQLDFWKRIYMDRDYSQLRTSDRV
jgi:hypothetical protein